MIERRRKRQDNGTGGAPPAARAAPDDRPLGRDRPVGVAGGQPAWGSDVVARVLRELGIPFIALNPGASFRGLHDSLVNFLGNERPEMILCLHEEHAVGIAHGYAKVTGRPLAVALHANVGLMHATMAIFNAWCDRVPMLILGATGPLDATQRRPWIDWIHSARDQGALVRSYTKWDDQPASVDATVESLLRANLLARTAPCGPTYVCLDAGLQEAPLEREPAIPEPARFAPPPPARPDPTGLGRAAELLAKAARPVILAGRGSRDPAAWDARVALAERLGATVLTDLKSGAMFPTDHPLHGTPPFNKMPAEARAILREADVVLSLDWVDLAGALHRAWAGERVGATVIQASVDLYGHGGWSFDYQGLPEVDVFLACPPDAAVAALLETLPATRKAGARAAPKSDAAVAAAMTGAAPDGVAIADLARALAGAAGKTQVSWLSLPRGWPLALTPFRHPLDYLGKDGGGGVGSGPGQAIGAALALRAHPGRLPIAVLGDGDYLMSANALWTAAHYGIPLLIVIANNRSYYNDEIHQESVAKRRGREPANRWIGQSITEPTPDLAALAEAQGVAGVGPVESVADLPAACERAVTILREGRPVVLDVHIAPGAERAVSAMHDRVGGT